MSFVSSEPLEAGRAAGKKAMRSLTMPPPPQRKGVLARASFAWAGPQAGSGFGLRTGADGRLRLIRDGEHELIVSVRRCFPWSYPLEWLSLRKDDGTEVELIETADELSDESRDALLSALLEAGFIFCVTRIVSIEEEFELRQWRVELKEGARIFQTRLNAWPRDLPSGGLLIQDVANDLYLVPDPESLDAPSQKLLWAFTDD